MRREGKTFDAVDPSTGIAFAEIPVTSAADVAELVADAHRALAVEPDWRVPATRARVLTATARAVEAQAEELAELECRDTGTPLSRARADVAATVRYLDACAGSVERVEGRRLPLGPSVLDYTVRDPWGVCVQVIGSDAPLQVAARHAAPALAAGNAVILKPSALASITPLRLAQIAEEAGLPRGLLQVATGDGTVGAALVEHPGVDHVTFAGAAANGTLVAEACARRLIPLELDAGGTTPHVVFADADLDAVAGALVRHGGSPLLAEAAIFEALAERLAAALAALTVGPAQDDPDVGPLISQRRLDRALALLATARADGATIVTGGAHAGGLLLEPTLVTGVRADAEIVREPVPGPVLCALPFSDEHEALALANGSPRALVAGVWTRDLARAHRVAAGIRAARVGVNCAGASPSVEIRAYTRSKHVRVGL